MLRVLSKNAIVTSLPVTPRYTIFGQFMRNALLGKVRLNQGKVNFCLKVILKKTAGEHICF